MKLVVVGDPELLFLFTLFLVLPGDYLIS